ncbi:MAG TPA: hypothetical protein VFH61_08235 [Thermoleophilia bacterium]|nr:hypothetical protein [Thermoleophilia bacterium]
MPAFSRLWNNETLPLRRSLRRYLGPVLAHLAVSTVFWAVPRGGSRFDR